MAREDSILVAGMTLMHGSALLRGLGPGIDARGVTRNLGSGGIIAGKAACEHLHGSGARQPSHQGPIRNPRELSHIAGGFSGACAALVAAETEERPMASGGDRDGSDRTTSARLGVFELQTSPGLEPGIGAMPISNAMDHPGSTGAFVKDPARFVTVIAGHGAAVAPTNPLRAIEIPADDSSREAFIRIALHTQAFASTLPVTGHPVVTDPETMQGGLPMRSTAVGRHIDEATLNRIDETMASARDRRAN